MDLRGKGQTRRALLQVAFAIAGLANTIGLQGTFELKATRLQDIGLLAALTRSNESLTSHAVDLTTQGIPTLGVLLAMAALSYILTVNTPITELLAPSSLDKGKGVAATTTDGDRKRLLTLNRFFVASEAGRRFNPENMSPLHQLTTRD